MNTLLANPYVWAFAMTTMMVWCCRRGMMNWMKGRLNRKHPPEGLDQDVYHLVRHIRLPVEAGQTPTCHLYVSHYGVFLVDSFDYGDLIFGNGHEAQWTRRLGPKHCQKFHNPLMLAGRRARLLATLLILPENQLIPIVAFNGENAWFNTKMPDCICCDQKSLVHFIKQHQTPILDDGEVTRIMETLATKQLATAVPEPLETLDSRYGQHSRQVA